MNFSHPDKNFEKVEKLSQSLTFEDIKDDYEQFQKLIRKHHPDGNFRIVQDVQPAMGGGGFQVRPSIAVLEFMHYLFSKYNDEIRVRAISNKIYRDYLMKK